MDLAKIKKLLSIVAESEVAEVEIEQDGLRVVVRKSAPTINMQAPPNLAPYTVGYYATPPPFHPAEHAMPPQAPEGGGNFRSATREAAAASSTNAQGAAREEETGEIIRAPIVGTFYRAPSPDSEPFVNVGDRVQPGDILCIIEAMKLMNEIESEASGVVRRILVENAEAVEFDQPLFIIEAD